MEDGPKLSRLDRRIRRSKRQGKTIFAGVFLGSVALGAVLFQGLVLALDMDRGDLVVRACMGLVLLALVDLLSGVLVWRQHRVLDGARAELGEVRWTSPPPGDQALARTHGDCWLPD